MKFLLLKNNSFINWLLIISIFLINILIINASPIDNNEEEVNNNINSNDDPDITDLLILDIYQSLPNYNANDDKTIENSSTFLGTIKIGLFGDVVPKTVENFKQLSSIYKDTRTLFHRVIPNFVIQAGDIDGKGGHSIYGEKGMKAPKGSNPDDFGPYYSGLEDENFILSHNKIGRVSVANGGKNTGGSQFFICLSPQLHLDGKHVVFGQVINGMDIAEKIANVEKDSNDKPLLDVFIKNAYTKSLKDESKISNTESTTTSNNEETNNKDNIKYNNNNVEDKIYAEDHPDGLGSSYHHYVFLPFTIFFSIAAFMAYRNRRNVSLLIRGPRYRRVSGMNV